MPLSVLFLLTSTLIFLCVKFQVDEVAVVNGLLTLSDNNEEHGGESLMLSSIGVTTKMVRRRF